MKGRALVILIACLALVLSTIGAGAAAPSWPTYHQDLVRSGNDTGEPPLSAVGSRWTSGTLDGNVYAEPLVVGHTLIVATENNSIYAFDAASGGVLWTNHLGTPVPGSSLPCGNINPVGITGTPVVDEAAGVLYAVGMVTSPAPMHYQLWALNLNNHGSLIWQEKISPPTGPGQLPFDATVQGQRTALTLNGGVVYFGFGGRAGDCGNYEGWIVGAPKGGPGPLYTFELPTSHIGGAIWATPGASIDSSGNLYASDGNTFCGTGCPSYDFSESVIKLSPTLAFMDYFHPSNWKTLNDNDTDLGSVSPELIGTSGLIFQVGKEGIGYLLNTSSLGGSDHQTPAYSVRVCTQTSDAAFGGAAYMAPYLFVPCSNRLEVYTVNTTTPSLTSVGHGPAVSRSGPPIVAQGLVWTIDPDNAKLYGLNPASPLTPVITQTLPRSAMHFATPTTGDGRIFVAAGTQVVGLGDFAISTGQYRLTGSNGSTWQDIDANNLAVTLRPAANSTAVVGGNADLWTATAGINQDLGISVSVNGGADQLIAWKESGGKAGTFSPNAAFVQTVYAMTANTSYRFKLRWKTNIPEGTASIFAGAGPLNNIFSPTSLSVHFLPAGVNPYSAVSTQQYQLPNSDGTTWTDMDATNLSLSITPGANAPAIIGANADLWTADAGINQDLGVFISGGAFGAGQIVAWKESGGNAGTFSPNAAFLQTVVSLVAATTYTVKLQWKSNISASGKTIYAAAGAGPSYSPTRLTAELVSPATNVSTAASTSQYRLTGSNGLSWSDIDATNLKLTMTPSSNTYVLLGGNADLWTENATVNQDLAISVSVDGGPDFVLAWKESGGFAGTFSPNAAFVQDVFAMAAGHTYIYKLKWKTNKGQAPGDGVRTGAGLGPQYSPTSLTAELISG